MMTPTDQEVTRCVVCGKVEIVDWSGPDHRALVDLGDGVRVMLDSDVPEDDPPLYWPDGMALTACPIHPVDMMLAAFDKYPENHWLEGKPNAGN